MFVINRKLSNCSAPAITITFRAVAWRKLVADGLYESVNLDVPFEHWLMKLKQIVLCQFDFRGRNGKCAARDRIGFQR